MESVYSFLKKYKFYIMAFLLTLLCGVIRISGTAEMRLSADDIGMMSSAVYLAGYDWSEVVATTPYYGCAFYFLFAPLFRLIDDPVILWGCVVWSNIFVMAATSSFVYHICTKYFCMKQNMITVLAVITAGLIVNNPQTFTQEPILYLSTWMIVYFLAKLIREPEINKKSIAYMCGLWGTCIYAYLAHSRAVAFIIAIVVVFLLMTFVDKKYLKYLLLYGAGSVLVYFSAEMIKNHVISTFWNTANGDITNSTLELHGSKFEYLLSLDGIKTCFDVLVGNILTAATRTSGIMYIAIILFFVMLWNLLKNKQLLLEKEVTVSYFFSFICAAMGVLALAITWGNMIHLAYGSGVNNYFKGFAYFRYFGTFLGPVLVGAIYFCVSKLGDWKYKKGFILAVLILMGGVSLYYESVIVPNMKGSEYLNSFFYQYIRSNAQGFDGSNFRISLLLVIAVVVVLLVKRNWDARYTKGVLSLGILFILLPYFDSLSIYKPIINTEGDATYALFEYLEEENYTVEEEIYAIRINNARVHQYNLKEYSIHVGIPEDDKEYLIFSDTNDCKELAEADYTCFRLDNNECIWTKNADLINHIRAYIEAYL